MTVSACAMLQKSETLPRQENFRASFLRAVVSGAAFFDPAGAVTGFGVFFKPRENAAGMTVAVAGTAQGEREEVLAKLLQFPDFVTDLFNVFRHLT